MNRQEIIQFIKDNQNEKLIDYYNKCYYKLDDLNKRIDKLTLYLIVIVFLYFIASSTTISSIQLGPATVSDISLLLKIIPVLFAFIILQIVIISSQKAELFTIVKLIFLSNYIQEVKPSELEIDKNNIFTRLLLPFSYSTQLLKFSTRKQNFLNGCIGNILVLPLASLLFLPFYFEYYMLCIIWKNYYSELIGKVSFWLSIWIILYVVYFMTSNIIDNFKERKNENF